MKYIEQSIDFDAALRDLISSNPKARTKAIESLVSCEEELKPKALDAVRPLLQDSMGECRAAAAMALGEFKDTESVPSLIDMIDGDGHQLARQSAVIALGQIGDLRAKLPLEKALKQGAPDVRFQATLSLVQVDKTSALPSLVKAKDDQDPEVRGNIAAALAEYSDEESLEILVEFLGDSDPRVKVEAAVSLAKRQDPRGTPLLLIALDDPNYAHLAAEYLFKTAPEEHKEVLLKHATRWFMPGIVKVWLTAALARMGETKFQEKLLEFLAKNHPILRGVAIQCLGIIDEKWATDALTEFSKRPDALDWQEDLQEALNVKNSLPKTPSEGAL